MKIRLSDGAIRLRLSEFEVAMLLEGRDITTTVTDGFSLTLEPAEGADLRLQNTEAGHLVRVPRAELHSPSMAHPRVYESPHGESPHLLIEMDRQN